MELTNEQKHKAFLKLENEFKVSNQYLCTCVWNLYSKKQINKAEREFLLFKIKLALPKYENSFSNDTQRRLFIFTWSNFYFDKSMDDLHNKYKIVIPKTTVQKTVCTPEERKIELGLWFVFILFLSFMALFIYGLNSI